MPPAENLTPHSGHITREHRESLQNLQSLVRQRGAVRSPGRSVERVVGKEATLRQCLLAVTVACAALFACGDPPPSKYPSQQSLVEDTTLGAGDLFEVRVFRQKDMSATYSVSSDGTINFPLIGLVHVGGKTPVEVETELRDRLGAGYLKNPQISVLVKEYRSKKVSVFGQVRKAGTFAYVDGMTIVEALSLAGGFNDMARKNAVTVTRKLHGKKKRFTVPVKSIGTGKADNFYIRPGDVVFVPRRLF